MESTHIVSRLAPVQSRTETQVVATRVSSYWTRHSGTLKALTVCKKKARGFPLEGLATVPWNTNLSNEAESQRIDTRGVSTVYNTPYHLSRLQRILWAELTI